LDTLQRVRHRRDLRSILELGLGVALAGCGFHASAGHAGPGDGGPGDAASDGPGSGAGDGSDATTSCWAHWMDGSVAIDAATVKEITELSSDGHDIDPWISSGGLRMYFSRSAGSLGHGDVYSASRDSPSGSFGMVAPVMSLNSANDEGRAWLTSTELAVALPTARDGRLDIQMSTRAALGDSFAPPVNAHLTLVNAKGNMRFEPFLTDDLRRLYFTADSGPSNKWQIWVAARATAGEDFGAPALVITDNSINYFAPALYQNEQLLVFSSFPNNQTADLYYATRSGDTGPFGAPARIPTVNTGSNDAEPVLGPDGCELYFASDRDPGGHFHLFHAQITR
jgi:WD40 repeat protein